MTRIIASGLVFVALLAFTLFAFAQQRAERIAAQPGWALTAVEGVDIPPATAAQARRVLARRPLNQPVLNLLFAIESRGTLDPERRETFIDTRSEEHMSELQSLMRISYAVFCFDNKNRTKAHKHKE